MVVIVCDEGLCHWFRLRGVRWGLLVACWVSLWVALARGWDCVVGRAQRWQMMGQGRCLGGLGHHGRCI